MSKKANKARKTLDSWKTEVDFIVYVTTVNRVTYNMRIKI